MEKSAAAATGDDPPPGIGQDERRMQVRAYNHWAALLEQYHFPLVASIRPADNDDFGPYGVMLDFAAGIENPLIAHLGKALAAECGVERPGTITQLSDVPPDSLLSRITDHYIQILANRTPIGFEAECVNRDRRRVLYRGILLPFSRDGYGIDHIFGVLNWKELAGSAIVHDLHAQLERDLPWRTAKARADGAMHGADSAAAKLLSNTTGIRIDTLDRFGPEYTLLLARRDKSGRIGVLGEVPYDEALLDRAADRMVNAPGTKARQRR